MRLRHLVGVFALLVLSAVAASAQTTVNAEFTIDAPIAAVTAATKEVRFNTVLQTAPIACASVNATTSRCSIVLPNTFLTGSHTVALKVANNGVAGETIFTGVNANNIPKSAGGLSVTVTTTVVVQQVP